MPKNVFQNSTGSLTLTGAGASGFVSAVGSGLFSGATQSVLAAKKASEVLSQNSSQRDSLFRALKALFEDPAKLDRSALETYMKEIKDGLVASNDSMAFVVRNALLSLVSGVSHASQIPLDIATVLKHTGKGLSDIESKSDKMSEASKKASTFDVNVDGASASVRSVSEAIGKDSDKILDEVYKDINIPQNSHAASHAKVAASSSAGGSIGTTAFIPTAVALATDAVGHVSREASAIHHFSAQESAHSADQGNVYHASSGTSKATQASDSHASKLESQHLEAALSNLDQVAKLVSDRTVSTPIATALIRLVVLSLFVESSRGINTVALATAEGRIQKALADATAQGPSGGVDRINSLHSNLSSLSNIMRLCAENLGGSGASTIETAVLSSEVVSSRSMSVLLSHVSELANAISLLVNPEQVQAEGSSVTRAVKSTLAAANPQVLNQSEAIIKGVLDRIEQENGHHVIPGLNRDMASQIDSSMRTGLASLVGTHSIVTNPSMVTAKGSKAASNTEDAQKNEALMTTLPSLTQMLNAVQASTRNFRDKVQQEIESGESKKDGSMLSTHRSFGSGTAAIMWSMSTILLLCDEMISICRSLTLIDKNRLQEASQQISAVPTKDESTQSYDQIGFDSHCGEGSTSAIHAVSALRLTLSHTGIALMRIALALHKALDGHMNTMQQDLHMHTLQRSLLESSAYASRYLAEGLLLSTGGASAFPVMFNGSANWSHNQVHSTDAHLHPAQTHGSENSCDSSASSQVTGFSTDLVAGSVTNLLKVLAQSGLIGLDTTLKLIKTLEILSLHRDSHIALRLETNDSSNPNGVSKNTLTEPSVGSSAGTGAILMNMLESLQTLDKSSGTQSTLRAQNRLKEVIDQHIEDLAVLRDDEESLNKKGLKEFYKIIINLLSPDGGDACDKLVKRLNYGGIALSSYHSDFGAYGDPVTDLRFVANFANDDNAQGILRRFIDKAKENYPLLKQLHHALPEAQMSSKAQFLYKHVYEEVFQRYKQVKMSDMAQFGGTKRKIPTHDMFEIDLGLRQVQPEIAEVVEAEQEPAVEMRV